MEILLTLLITWLILNVNMSASTSHHDFIKQLAVATAERYSSEYSKLRTHEESIGELQKHLDLINPTMGVMDPFDYSQFKAGVCKAIHASDKSLRAELCFIHDLMLEEYHRLVPNKASEHEVGINEFYNLLRGNL